MCKSRLEGGKRCNVDLPKVNTRRRGLYALKQSRQMLDDVITSQGNEWTGDTSGIGFKITSPLVAKAYALAVKAHAGVKRKSGEPYINHPLRVAQHLQEKNFNDEVVAVALLHDAVEDSDLKLSDLRRFGFDERIVSGVDSVTKRLGEEYPDAIERAKKHPIGRLVKLSDNRDNSSEEQLAPFDDARKAKQRAKYTPARHTLIISIKDMPHDSLVQNSLGFSDDYKIKLNENSIDEIFG